MYQISKHTFPTEAIMAPAPADPFHLLPGPHNKLIFQMFAPVFTADRSNVLVCYRSVCQVLVHVSVCFDAIRRGECVVAAIMWGHKARC